MRSRAMRRAAARYLWDRLKVSLWFMPLVMAIAAILLLWLIRRLGGLLGGLLGDTQLKELLYSASGSAASMRNGLLGIAGVVLGTAGIVFTLLTLPLGTMASQYGSRLLRLFLRDRTTQLVLGVFVGTFVFNLVAALTLPQDVSQPETATVTLVTGALLMMLTFASLIALIQHISTMLQAPNIVAAAGAELLEVIYESLPDQPAESVASSPTPGQPGAGFSEESPGFAIRVRSTGYIQYLDPQILLSLAVEKDLVIRLLRRTGEFVWPGMEAAQVWPATSVDERLDHQIRRAIQIGNQRTPTQDVEYAVNQLVEVAVRAMSPAINDPFTAMTCLDYLADGLAKYANYDQSTPYYYEITGRLRLIFETFSFNELLCSAFNMLRHASCDNASVLLKMLDVIEAIGHGNDSEKVRLALLEQVELVQAESQVGDLVEADRQRIRARAEALKKNHNRPRIGNE